MLKEKKNIWKKYLKIRKFEHHNKDKKTRMKVK